MPYRHPPPGDAAEAKLLADVEAYGWHVVLVSPDPGGHTPTFGYSVGLFHTFGHAEVIVIGLPHSTTHVILNSLGNRVRAGEEFAPSTRDGGLLEGFDMGFVGVAATFYPIYLGFAMWFYRYYPNGFPVVQGLWPDRLGTLPTDPGFQASLRGIQPILSGAA